MDLNNKVIVITGAARGLGFAMAQEMVSHGAHVALLDVDAGQLDSAAEDLRGRGGHVKTYVTNVADEAQVQDTFDQIVVDFDRLDALINNAGIIRDALLVKVRDGEIVSTMSLAQWQSVMDVNLTGVFLCGRAAAVKMIELGNGGVMINISSISRAGNRGQTNYSAAKAGVDAMAVTWARELARYNIRAAAISPGFTETELVASMPPDALSRIAAAIPMGRLAQPSEIARTATFILENDYINGRNIEVDGALRL
jgi:3-oxoacyl-[acyl-carrier protein] reductase